MPVRLIPCRLKDDHDTVQEIGETALPYFPEWEPIPVEELPEDHVAPEPVHVEPEPEPQETPEERDERNRRALAGEQPAEDAEDKPSRSRTRKTTKNEGEE